jgi:hypothetical protein
MEREIVGSYLVRDNGFGDLIQGMLLHTPWRDSNPDLKFLWRTGLPDGIFETKNPYLGKFWRVLQWKFMSIWSILRPFGICCLHLVYFMDFGYIFPRFGMLYQEKSGNPADGRDDKE